MRVSVLVPTYRRTSELRRCLEALRSQERPADEVLVTVRDTDEETQAFFAEFDACGLSLHLVSVCEGGVVAAMNAGLQAAQGDILALTDDDSAPFPDWLARIEGYFAADPHLGGIGGRDWMHYGDGTREARTHPDVGRVQWHGRLIGNHHLGAGPPRPVDLLKGVNSAYRMAALRPVGFDRRLRGSGAQVHWELSLGLALRRDGWKLVYDPALAVEHYHAPRRDADTNHRGVYHAASHTDIIYNETLILLDHLSFPRRVAFLLWAMLVGSKAEPGLVAALYLVAKRAPSVSLRMKSAAQGRIAALRTFLAGRK